MQEVLKWLSAIPMLLGIGLSLGSNPAIYGALIDMLARTTRALPRLLWLMAGLVTGVTILFVVFLFFNPTDLVTLLRGKVDHVLLNRSVDIAGGILCLVLAAALWIWRLRVPVRPTRPTKKTSQEPANPRMLGYYSIGLSGGIVGFTTLPLMYLTGRVITGLTADWALRVVAYAIFLVALTGPFFLIAWLWRQFPKLSVKISAVYQRVVSWDYRIVAAIILALGGLAFFGLAIFEWHAQSSSTTTTSTISH
ncbi:hypothetical protein [Gulosibacter chungangensis]|uniref:GAP family protein n=1 Tax=Gulosibacter chungangensis TaxID=979746 RepID=A0A7J5B8M8_9MICO|nr:hypothetical protein [Gulosibacter chungangensis]KAB1641619.1 hypothetical protein F8O05_11725 [Gulosibacter chungangensis]